MYKQWVRCVLKCTRRRCRGGGGLATRFIAARAALVRGLIREKSEEPRPLAEESLCNRCFSCVMEATQQVSDDGETCVVINGEKCRSMQEVCDAEAKMMDEYKNNVLMDYAARGLTMSIDSVPSSIISEKNRSYFEVPTPQHQYQRPHPIFYASSAANPEPRMATVCMCASVTLRACVSP